MVNARMNLLSTFDPSKVDRSSPSSSSHNTHSAQHSIILSSFYHHNHHHHQRHYSCYICRIWYRRGGRGKTIAGLRLPQVKDDDGDDDSDDDDDSDYGGNSND